MTSKKLSSRDRRAVLAGVALIVVAWLATSGLPHVREGVGALRERRANSSEQLARVKAVLASEPEVRSEFAATASRLRALAPRLIAGASAADAAASLAAMLTLVAQRSHLRVNRLEPVADSASGPFTRITMRLEVVGDIRGLARWLAVLEENRPTLALTELSVAASDLVGRLDTPEQLRAQLLVSGWSAVRPDSSR